MRLVMTLVVRDEADIIDAQIAYHLNAGVDLVIAIDHRSVDGTTEILESYAREGYLRLIRRDDVRIEQSEWVTNLARLAATEHEADWVLNSDADEFWWPRASSLKDALGAVPPEYDVVYAPMCYFLPRPGNGEFFERMTIRLLQTAPINNPLSRYRPSPKAAHRASPDVVVRRGNHQVEGIGRSLSSWHPLELLHFPDRSPDQIARKYENTVASWPSRGREPGAFVIAAQTSVERAGAKEAFEQRQLAHDDLADAATAHMVVVDTRVRDVLRRLRSTTGSAFLRPPEFNGRLAPSTPSAADEARHAVDVAVLAEADLIRVNREVDDLEHRLRALEVGRRV